MSAVDNKMDLKKQVILRKKRVKRIKSLIIAAIVILIMIPITLCVGLMVKVNKIESRIEKLSFDSGTEFTDYMDNSENKQSGSVVLAKELPDSEETPDGLDTSDEQLPADQEEETDKKEDLILTPEEQLDLDTETKKVYLTFDDGPGKYTDELLDVLAENDIKATFFVIGRTDEHSLKMYKRIVDEGHTLGMHSYSHQYSKIYKSIKAFDKDFNKISNLLYETTGVRPKYYRFPGGSSNLVSDIPMCEFIKYLKEKDVTYYDWNVINGDATGKVLSPKQMVSNVMSGVKQNRNSMVLMHDSVSKDTTVKSLPVLIEKLKKSGYVILPVTKYSNTVQHIKADSVE